MAPLKPTPSRALLIGDVVDSRSATDRQSLHDRLVAALETVGASTQALESPGITVGDEFQGAWPTVGLALDAALRIRLALLPDADVRCGVGWGPVAALDDQGIQDGPGWWAAREAIVAVKDHERRAATRWLRTAYLPAPGADGPEPHAVTAALECRDHLVGSMDDRSRRILGGLMAAHTRADIARSEGISASAVSQRAINDGIDVVLRATDQIRQIG